MKKHFFYFISASALIAACSSAPEKTGNLKINGKLSDAAGESVYLLDLNDKQQTVIDSAKIDENGEFVLAARSTEIGVYNVKISGSNFCMMILDTTDQVTLSGSAKDLGNTYKVTGSPSTELFLQFNDFSKQNSQYKSSLVNLQKQLQQNFEYALNANKTDAKYIDSIDKATQPRFDSIAVKMDSALAAGVDYAKNFIDKNSGKFATIIALNMLDPEMEFEYYKKVDEALTAAYPGIKTLQPFHDFIEQKKKEIGKWGPGAIAPDFTVNDPDGKPISLSSFKGKIVLLDFWASWCGPCRKENPNVVLAYEKYHKRGLEIFAVSLDAEKEKWLEAIKQDKLTWKHGSELKQWQSSFVPLYEIQGIPMNFLIDAEGKIIAKNLRGGMLEKKLAEIFPDEVKKL